MHTQNRPKPSGQELFNSLDDGRIEIYKLLEKGADPNFTVPGGWWSRWGGWSSLAYAVWIQNDDLVWILLYYGASAIQNYPGKDMPLIDYQFDHIVYKYGSKMGSHLSHDFHKSLRILVYLMEFGNQCPQAMTAEFMADCFVSVEKSQALDNSYFYLPNKFWNIIANAPFAVDLLDECLTIDIAWRSTCKLIQAMNQIPVKAPGSEVTFVERALRDEAWNVAYELINKGHPLPKDAVVLMANTRVDEALPFMRANDSKQVVEHIKLMHYRHQDPAKCAQAISVRKTPTEQKSSPPPNLNLVMQNDAKQQEMKNAAAVTNPQNILWKPRARRWAYSVNKHPTRAFWKKYPSPASMQIDAAAELIRDNQLSLEFSITFQPPVGCKVPTDWKEQCIAPYQDVLSFQCTTDSKEVELKTFTPKVPNKPVTISSASSFHLGPEIELGTGLSHEEIHGNLKIGIGHLASHHKSSQGIKAFEVTESNSEGNNLHVVETLMYCNSSSSEFHRYNPQQPDDSIVKSKKIIFGWDKLCLVPAVAKNQYVMKINACYQLPQNYKLTDLKFKLILVQRINLAEIWNRDRTQVFTNYGSAIRELNFHQHQGKLKCGIQTVAAMPDRVDAKHYVHSTLSRFDCCFFTLRRANKSKKDKDKDQHQAHLMTLNLASYE